MKSRQGFPRLLLAACVICAAGTSRSWGQQWSWPVEPQSAAHTVGNTLEAYWSDQKKCWVFHAGIDIRATPYLDANGNDDPTKTWVRAVAGGKVLKARLSEPTPDNYLVIEATGGERHTYAHLAAANVPASVSVVGATVAAGDVLGAVDVWPDCSFHHLHFERRTLALDVLDPLALIGPRADAVAPEIQTLVVAPRDDFRSGADDGVEVPTNGCIALNVGSEVHARIVDRGDHGTQDADIVGVRELRLERLPPGQSTYQLLGEIRPAEVAKAATASAAAVEKVTVVSGKFKMTGDYCQDKTLWYRWAGEDSANGVLDPETLGPGIHTIRVHVVDFAGASTDSTFRVCVPGASVACAGFPLVKDCLTDVGLVPSSCAAPGGGSVAWLTPPSSAGPSVQICVTNGGCEAANLSEPLSARFELDGCQGPACAAPQSHWDATLGGYDAEFASVAPGEARCIETPLPPTLATAISSATAGRVIVRVVPQGSVFASTTVENDPAAAAIPIK